MNVKLDTKQEVPQTEFQKTLVPPRSDTIEPIPEIVQHITEFPIVPQTTHQEIQQTILTESTTPTTERKPTPAMASKEKLKEDRRNKAKMFLLLQQASSTSTNVLPTSSAALPAPTNMSHTSPTSSNAGITSSCTSHLLSQPHLFYR